MGGLFGGAPSMSAMPAAPPPPPQAQQPQESSAAAQAEQRASAAAGVGATIATGAGGVQKRATLGEKSLIGD